MILALNIGAQLLDLGWGAESVEHHAGAGRGQRASDGQPDSRSRPLDTQQYISLSREMHQQHRDDRRFAGKSAKYLSKRHFTHTIFLPQCRALRDCRDASGR